MPGFDQRNISGPALIPAREPERKLIGQLNGSAMPALGTGAGTAFEPHLDSTVNSWIVRHQSWCDGFNQAIAPNAKKYWQLYRNLDPYPDVGPDGYWRDKTVVPGPFREVMTRVPRLFLGMFQGREWFTVEGRGKRDEDYEALAKSVLDFKIDQMDEYFRQEPWMARSLEAFIYEQVMGHVWWKLTWRKEMAWRKTKMPGPGPEKSWQDIEVPELLFDGLDLQWLGLDRLAINLEGPRIWAIEPIFTTLEAMKQADKDYYKATGTRLYKPEVLKDIETASPAIGPEQTEGYSEPRDTEAWPMLEAESRWGITGKQLVEIWLCWDNDLRTLTKIANRHIILDHGDAPTPDGFDPYWGTKAVPIPGRTYGDSYLNWTGDLHKYNTRLRRSRADEILLNLFQQFMFRTGFITSPKLLFQPGGGIGVETPDPHEDIRKSIAPIPRHPVFEEVWREQAYCTNETEKVSATDAIAQGDEATQTSRKVSATEVQQRVTQGNARYQVENLYKEWTWKKPFLTRAYKLLQQNMTEEETIRVMDEEVPVDLTKLQTPIDIKVGGGIYEYSKAERGNDVLEMVGLAQVEAFAPYFKAPEVLKKLLQVRDWKNPEKYLRTDEEVQQKQMEQLAMQQAVQPPAGGPANGNPAGAMASNLLTQPNGGSAFPGSMPGMSGPTGASDALGRSPAEAPAGPNQSGFEEL